MRYRPCPRLRRGREASRLAPSPRSPSRSCCGFGFGSYGLAFRSAGWERSAHPERRNSESPDRRESTAKVEEGERSGTAAGMTDAEGEAKLVWRSRCPAREEAPMASVPMANLHLRSWSPPRSCWRVIVELGGFKLEYVILARQQVDQPVLVELACEYCRNDRLCDRYYRLA